MQHQIINLKKRISPFLSIDHNGPWLVSVILQDHAYSVSIHPLDVDGVGSLTGPVNVATVGVQAQVMKLVVHWLDTAADYHGRLEANIARPSVLFKVMYS